MKYQSNTNFIDFLFNLLIGLFVLFTIAFLMIRPSEKEAEMKKTKAEYLITMTWDYDNPDDIDIWIRDPLDNILYFSRKETGIMHLDRDDRGSVKDIIYLSDGTSVEYKENQEIVSLRGYIYGEWIINLHAYIKRQSKPAIIEIKIDKLNPKVKTLFLKQFTLSDTWDEITVARFIMKPGGETGDWNDIYFPLVVTEYPDGPAYHSPNARGWR